LRAIGGAAVVNWLAHFFPKNAAPFFGNSNAVAWACSNNLSRI
jgi:hypothetical protein